VNKKIIIGIIIVIVIGIGVFSLAQISQNDETVNADVEELKRPPQSFTVGLSESIGFKETP